MAHSPRAETQPTKILSREEDIAVKALQKYNPDANNINV